MSSPLCNTHTIALSRPDGEHSAPLKTYGSLYKTASFQKEAMRTQVALYFFYEVKFV